MNWMFWTLVFLMGAGFTGSPWFAFFATVCFLVPIVKGFFMALDEDFYK